MPEPSSTKDYSISKNRRHNKLSFKKSLDCHEGAVDVVIYESFSNENSELFEDINRKQYGTGNSINDGFKKPDSTLTHYHHFTGSDIRKLKTIDITNILQNISGLKIKYIVGTSNNGGENVDTNEDLMLKLYSDSDTEEDITIYVAKAPNDSDLQHFSADKQMINRLKKCSKFEIYQKFHSKSDYDQYGIVSVELTSSEITKGLEYRECQLRNLLKNTSRDDANIDFTKFENYFLSMSNKNKKNTSDYKNLEKYFNKFYYNVTGNISIKNDNLETEIAKHKLEIKYRLNDIYIKTNKIEILKLLITGLLLSLLVIILNKYLVVELPVINIISLIMSLFVFLIMIRVVTNSNKLSRNFREFNYGTSPFDEKSFWDKFTDLLLGMVPWSSSGDIDLESDGSIEYKFSGNPKL